MTNGRNVHIVKALQQVAIKYRPQGMIADKIFPVVPVDHQSDAYNIWSIADAFRISDSRRAPDTEANKINFDVTSAIYYAQNYALQAPITVEDYENADPAYLQELRNNRVMRIMDDLSLGWEQRLANQLTSGSNVGSYAGVSSGWSDYATGKSDPYADIEAAYNVVKDSTGYSPNFIVMGYTSWRNLRKNADLINLIHGTAGQGTPNRIATQQGVAQLFEVDDVLVGDAYYNSADKGQSATLAQLWGDNVLVGYRAPRPSTEEPSLGYGFRWRKGRIANMNPEFHAYDTKKKSESVEVGYYQDEVVTAAALGYLITNPSSAS